jgi:hypothetical protein
MPSEAVIMGNSDTLDARLRFVRIDDELRATLRALKPVIARALPGVLDVFYAHIRQFPEVARLFPDGSIMRHAREMQIKHWDMISDGVFDAAYVESVTRVGAVHHRLGLAPQWYIGGYSFLIAGLTRAIETEVRVGRFGKGGAPAKKAAMLSALTMAPCSTRTSPSRSISTSACAPSRRRSTGWALPSLR